MAPLPQKEKRSVNEEARRAHRRQVIWQIFLPLVIGILIAIALFVMVLQSGAATIERSAQTATVLLAIPLLVSGFVFLFLLIALSSGMNRLIKWLPHQSYRAQKLAQQLNIGTTRLSRSAKQPFFLVDSWGNAIGRVIRRRG